MAVFQLQKVGAPPAAGAFVKKDAPPTAFRKFYERGDFPIALEHDTKGNKIAWKVCIICYHVMKRNSKLTYFLITLLLIILCCMFLGWDWKIRLSSLSSSVFWWSVWNSTPVWILCQTGCSWHARAWWFQNITCYTSINHPN